MYATETAREVDLKYVDTGLVKFVHWDLPLGSHGYPAVVSAEASHCAGEQDAFWEMHAALFDNWKALSELDPEDEGLAIEAIVGYGESVVADSEAFSACVSDNKYRPVVATMLRQAMDMKIDATPSFLLSTVGPDGKQHVEPIMGYLPFEEMAPLIDREISRAQGTPIPTNTPAPTFTPAPAASPSAESGDSGG